MKAISVQRSSRPSNQSWLLPSICTSSPAWPPGLGGCTLARRPIRDRHSPASIICRHSSPRKGACLRCPPDTLPPASVQSSRCRYAALHARLPQSRQQASVRGFASFAALKPRALNAHIHMLASAAARAAQRAPAPRTHDADSASRR